MGGFIMKLSKKKAKWVGFFFIKTGLFQPCRHPVFLYCCRVEGWGHGTALYRTSPDMMHENILVKFRSNK